MEIKGIGENMDRTKAITENRIRWTGVVASPCSRPVEEDNKTKEHFDVKIKFIGKPRIELKAVVKNRIRRAVAILYSRRSEVG